MDNIIWIISILFTVQTITIGIGLISIEYAIKEKRNKKINIKLSEELINEVAGLQEHNKWHFCSEEIPNDRAWYLAVFQEVDTGFITIPYIADYLNGMRTRYTTDEGWIIRGCTDREDENVEYYKKLRCIAWMPLPKFEREG